jgi:hypothetical protein
VKISVLAVLLLVLSMPGHAAPMAELTIAQLQYDGGGDWYANPTGLPNLVKEIRARTGVPMALKPASVRLTDRALWDFPFIYVTGHGNMRFSPEEVRILRQYLESGGFLHVDDNYGLDESFRREIRRVFPERALVQLPVDHAVYGAFYRLPDGLPKIHKHDGKPAQGFGIFHEGRLVLFYSYESDLGNGWEDVGKHDLTSDLREKAFRMGVNLFVYALAQVAP